MSAILQQRRVLVWDPVIRAGHWALVAAFTVAYLTGEGEDGTAAGVHAWAGYAIGVILAVRILWGFVGPTQARFSNVLYSPTAALRYLADLVRGRACRFIGHSPAGGAMVFALLVCLIATLATGLVANGDQGRQQHAIRIPRLVTYAYADRDNDESRNRSALGAASAIGDLHGTLANLTLALVVLHLLCRAGKYRTP